MARVKRSRSIIRRRKRKVSGYRSVKRSRYRKRSGNKYSRYSSTSLFLRYRNPLLASKLNTSLQYNTNIQLNPQADNLGSGGSNVWFFSVNNLYDPDVTGTGHQPMYFDNYAAVYNRYRVNWAQITVTVINHEVNTEAGGDTTLVTSPNYSYKLAIIADRDVSDYPATMNRIIEEGGPNIKWRFVAPSLVGTLPKLFHSASPHRLTQLSFGDDTLQADIGAAPSRQCYFGVAITSADGNTDPPNVYLNVRIKYYCTFFDRRVLQSEN